MGVVYGEKHEWMYLKMNPVLFVVFLARLTSERVSACPS